ncbi:hypothetical protein LIER_27392 [Lithospermum erythrorhizon]|uniref:Protein SPIRAL1-like 1 n=1 Tax=Lithospermum erythrorhizon TaxID=34254 RepID=A0AAV3RFT8_LITER
MGRGVSAGGGQSSLGYLFGSGESPNPTTIAAQPASNKNRAHQVVSNGPLPMPKATQAVDITKQIPAGIQSGSANNHFGADGKSTNYISDRPSTKVHAAPGGGSSLGYLFGDGSN